MATNKNITMKQFNGTDYDTLYPKTVAAQIPDVFSQSETVNAEMLSKYGLGASGTPNDVFGVLSRFQNGLGNEYVWSKSDATGIVGYVNSPNPSAYPPAVSDGYVYRELGQIAKKLNVYNIREITTEAKASTIEIDISDLDLNEWEFLVAELVPSSGNGGGFWWAKGTGLNSNDMYYSSLGDIDSSSAGLGSVSDFTNNKLHTYMVLMPHKNEAQTMKALTFGPGMSYGRSSTRTFEPITSLVIAGTSENYYLSAGAKIYLWGVK